MLVYVCKTGGPTTQTQTPQTPYYNDNNHVHCENDNNSCHDDNSPANQNKETQENHRDDNDHQPSNNHHNSNNIAETYYHSQPNDHDYRPTSYRHLHCVSSHRNI